jgi:hypothetical protein
MMAQYAFSIRRTIKEVSNGFFKRTVPGWVYAEPANSRSLTAKVSFRLGGRISLYYSPVSCQDHFWQLTNDQEEEKRVLFANQRQMARGKRKVALDALFENLLQ